MSSNLSTSAQQAQNAPLCAVTRRIAAAHAVITQTSKYGLRNESYRAKNPHASCHRQISPPNAVESTCHIINANRPNSARNLLIGTISSAYIHITFTNPQHKQGLYLLRTFLYISHTAASLPALQCRLPAQKQGFRHKSACGSASGGGDDLPTRHLNRYYSTRAAQCSCYGEKSLTKSGQGLWQRRPWL